METSYLLLFLFITINSIKLEGTLKFLDVSLLKMDLEILNIQDFEQLINQDINYGGKLCYVQNFTQYIDDCRNKFESYNSKWFLLINSTDFYQEIFRNNNNLTEVYGILIDLNITEAKAFNIDTFIPIVSLKTNEFKLLVDQDIASEKENKFFYISYHIQLNLTTSNFIFFLSIGVVIITLFASIIYNKRVHNTYRAHSNQLNKSINLLPQIRVLLGFIITYYIFTEVNAIYNNKGTSQYIAIIYQSIKSLYLTLLWFFMILISDGFGVYYQDMQNKWKLKHIALFFISLDLLFFIDPFLDSMMTQKLSYLLISDYKNFIMFTVLSCYIIYGLYKIFKKLKDKLIFTSEFLPEYNDSLLLKIHMVRMTGFIVISYTISYIIIVVIFRTTLPMTPDIILTAVIKFFNDFFMIVVIFVFRPRIYPRFFNDSLESDKDEEIGLYKVILPELNKLTSNNDFGININCYNTKSENKESPIVFINPIFKGESNCNIDKISFGYMIN